MRHVHAMVLVRRAVFATPVAVLALVAGAHAWTPATVALGEAPPALPGATALGELAPTAPLKLTVVLAPRDPAALAALATAVSTPGSPEFHRYLNVRQFAARFGAAQSSVTALRATLRASGLRPGQLAPNGLSLSVAGTASQVSHAFSVSLRGFRERGGRRLFANTTAPRVPAALGGVVTAVLGLDNVPAAVPLGLASEHATHTASVPFTGGSSPTPCASASSASGSTGPYTIDQLAHAYGMNVLYGQGDFGAGVTIALVELESNTATDLAAFQSCFNTSGQVNAITVPPGPGASGNQTGLETALDFDIVNGLAPQSTIDIYEGENSTTGVYDTFSAIIDRPNPPQVVSDSWGQCEPESDPTLVAAENTLFQQAAVQGQSILAASGDSGSHGCTDMANSGLLAVDDPASQPYATAVGGTTLGSPTPPAAQSVWNMHSGGGISTSWPMPSYQANSGVPGVLNSYTPGTLCQGGNCREVPDVSADADPNTGYVVYYAGLGGWIPVGGTSGAAPVWAGLVALADASGTGGCTPTTPLGFLNPHLYAIAAGSGASTAYTDIVSGDNNPSGTGAYPATTAYDMASGLGTPIATDGAFPGLVAQLCGFPWVSSLSPADAPAGSAITINGGDFTAGASVAFGAVAAGPVTVASTSKITTTVPAGAGVVDVNVKTTAGTSQTIAADRFTYAPTVTITTPASGHTYTQSQTVLASYACAASTSGTPACTAPVAPGAPIDTTTPGAKPFTVGATDANGVSTSVSAPYTVIPPPQIMVTVPTSGATYFQGQHVTAQFACITSAPVVIASCGGSVANGGALATAALGTADFTVSAQDSNGVAAQSSVTYTVVVAHPTVAKLHQSARTWLEHHHSGVHLPVGTTFSFSLNQAARVTLRFTRTASGTIAGGRCVATSRTPSHGRACTRTVNAGTVTFQAGRGVTAHSFSGHTSAGTLAPGTYTVSITATGLSGRPSAVVKLRFTIAAAATGG